ncbi:unnamed protein product [Hymenolepis diminuta]|uniref:Uncharacterized protein n=1 Tax=Hymenolepis diminuta TaxID=6216 RepID=A0A564YC04_HYMDI|nr:unnamed protein product [Hymenolepis diminuta]
MPLWEEDPRRFTTSFFMRNSTFPSSFSGSMKTLAASIAVYLRDYRPTRTIAGYVKWMSMAKLGCEKKSFSPLVFSNIVEPDNCSLGYHLPPVETTSAPKSQPGN